MEDEKCQPEKMPGSSKTRKVAGATERSKAREVNEVLPPCAEDLVCKAMEPKNFVCTRENPSGKASGFDITL